MKDHITNLKNKLTMTFIVVLYLILALGVTEVILIIKNSDMKNYEIEIWKYSKKLKKTSPDPILGYEPIPSTSALLQSVQIRTNKWGLRGGDISETPIHQRRILFLGSSITMGWGVKESDTVSQQLQELLLADQQDVEVLNAGVANYNTVRYVELFLTKLKKLHPTDIVIQGVIHDIEPLSQGSGNAIFKNSQLAVTLLIAASNILQKEGDLLKLYQEKYKPTLFLKDRSAVEEHCREIYQSGSPYFQEMKAALKRLSVYTSKNHIRVYFAMIPEMHDLQHYKFFFVHDIMKQLAKENGFEFIDLYPALSGLTPEKGWVMPSDPHPNALGHKLMAEAIYPVIREKK